MSNITSLFPGAICPVGNVPELHDPARRLTPWRDGLGTGPILDRDREHVLRHLLRLSDEDRRLRFMHPVSDAALHAHVAGLDFSTATRLGMWAADGTLVGMVEAFPDDAKEPQDVELAFSTDSNWRRVGVARALYRAMAAKMGASGARRLVLHCAAQNRPTRALLRAIGAETRVDAGEVDAICRLLPRGDAQLDIAQSFYVAAEHTARRLFATLPHGAVYADRLVPAMATSLLVATLESICIDRVRSYLRSDETIVGTDVGIRHVAMALPGHRLFVRGSGRWLSERIARFEVDAGDSHGPVANAHVVLAIVSLSRAAAQLAAKAAPGCRPEPRP